MGDRLDKEIGTILVVDDEVIITDLVQNILTKEGYCVHIANDGINGEKLAKDLHPDLILMDITMPGMNGYKVTERIKNYPELKDIPVIFLTGKTPNEDGGKAFAVGGVTYMVKPFTNQQLKDLVRLAIESVKVKDFNS